MFNPLFRTSLAALAFLGAAAAAQAAPNPVLEALGVAPVTVLTYGLDNLGADYRDAFLGATAASYSVSAAPMTGSIADLVNVLYSEKNGTITLNMVKIDKLPEGVTADDACAEAMTALRRFAVLDPTSGKPYDGSETSALAYYFMPEGSPVGAAATLAQIDTLFRLRYNASTQRERFTCTANLLDANYSIETH
jgi:hypothetical protein